MNMRFAPPMALAALLIAKGLQAQEAGVFATIGRSNVDELGDPRGGGVYLAWFPLEQLGVRFEYARSESSARWAGFTCDFIFPPEGCVEETVETDARHDVLDWGLVVVPLRLRGWGLETSVGVSRVDQEHEVVGLDTGRFLDRTEPGRHLDLGFDDLSPLFGADRNSTFWGLGVSRKGLLGRPLTLAVHWKRRTTDGPGCFPDDYCPPWVDGFRVTEARLAAGWKF
jgi:hypothetical protein